MDAEARKKHILRCAKKLFSRKGYYHTQISDIIQEAGIARGTIYQYFKNKDDIFITLLEGFYSDWKKVATISREDLELDSIKPANYLKFRIIKTLQFFQEDRELCNIVLRMGQGLSQDFEKQMKRFEKKILVAITGDLNLGQEFNRIPKELNVELIANLLAGGLFRVSYFYFSGDSNLGKEIDIGKMADEIVAFVSPGLFLKKTD